MLIRRTARQEALGASGLRKGDHIIDPRTGAPARGRRAAWVAVPRPDAARAKTRTGEGPRLAPAAVADALTTACLLLSLDEIEALCGGTPGVEAWILPEPDDSRPREPDLLHVGGSGTGYTSTLK